VIVIEIMPHHFFKINYIFKGIITEKIHVIIVKNHV